MALGQLLLPDLYQSFQQGAQAGREQKRQKTLADYAQGALGGDQGALSKIYSVDPESGMKIEDTAQQRKLTQSKLADADLERLGRHARMVTALADAGDMQGAQSLYDTIYPEASSKLGPDLPKQLNPQILQHMKSMAEAMDPQKPSLIKGAPGDVFMDQRTGKPAFTVPGDKAPPSGIQELQYLQSHPDLLSVKERLAAAGRQPRQPSDIERKLELAKTMGATPDELKAMVLGSAASVGAGVDSSDPLSGLSPQDQALVKGLASYKVLPSALGRSKNRQDLIARAAMLNPNFSEADSKQAYSFLTDLSKTSNTSAGGQIQAANTALHHLETLMRANKELGGHDMNWLNKVQNFASSEMGNHAVTNWNQAKTYFSEEMAKLLKAGVASESEIKAIEDSLDASRSPDQRNNAIEQAAEFLHGRLKALEDRRDSLLGSMSPRTSFLTPDSERVLQEAYKLGGRDAPQLRPSAEGGSYTSKAGQKQGGGYKMGQVLNVGGKQYKVVGLSDPNDPDLEAL